LIKTDENYKNKTSYYFLNGNLSHFLKKIYCLANTNNEWRRIKTKPNELLAVFAFIKKKKKTYYTTKKKEERERERER
jgi:hypothetical protein